MDLLLLLSAFLTALTGAITGVRPAQAAAQEQVVAAAVQASAVSVRTVVPAPVQGWPVLASIAGTRERAFAALPVLPGFGLRRRE